MFKKNKQTGRKALVPFLTAGDPNLEVTKKIILDMAVSGADLIEIGVPFSDPMAEGPVIQEANIHALAVNTTMESVMNMVVEIREESQIPLVYLLYYNTMISYGLDAFFARCAEVGIDGIIIPDLPYEESDEIDEYTEKYNVYQIMMVAPTSKARMEKICNKARGFLYCVSSMGVTGMRNNFSTDFHTFFKEINEVCAVPTCIGFGISTPEQVTDLKQYCDGVIVGSAIVKRIMDGCDEKEKISSVHQFILSLREALS